MKRKVSLVLQSLESRLRKKKEGKECTGKGRQCRSAATVDDAQVWEFETTTHSECRMVLHAMHTAQ